jgi:hypothetical protein
MFTAPLPFLLGWLFGLLSLTLLGGGLLILYAWYAGELVETGNHHTDVGLSGLVEHACQLGLVAPFAPDTISG